jgi:enoyl-CoA hydratase/carnithine racemase
MSAVRFEVLDDVALITLDRPEVRNAVHRATADALAAALDRLDGDPNMRAGVLTGAGSIFSAGMDLKAFSATGERPVHARRGGFGIVEQPPATSLIAAVEGTALGGGFEIALACDLIVAADNAAFGLPEVKRGLMAAAGGVLRLPRRLPRNIAMEMVLTGEPISAAVARDLGLVNRLVAPGDAVAVALKVARSIAGNAPLAVRTSKYLLDAALDWPAERAFSLQAEHAERVRSSADAAEGARAFLDRREPRWVGA